MLAAAKGETKNGTPIVLEKESGEAWQLWTLTKHENGRYSIAPKHAPSAGDRRSRRETGAGHRRSISGQNSGNDQHLEWLIKPLAGTGVAAAEPAADGGQV